MLLDIATEELSHLEVIGTIVAHAQQGRQGRSSPRASRKKASCTARSPARQRQPHHAGALRRRPAADQLRRRAVDGGLHRHHRRADRRPALQHRRRGARQDRLRAADQRHRRSRRQGSARLPDDARDRAPEVVREGALRDRAELPAGQAAGRSALHQHVLQHVQGRRRPARPVEPGRALGLRRTPTQAMRRRTKATAWPPSAGRRRGARRADDGARTQSRRDIDPTTGAELGMGEQALLADAAGLGPEPESLDTTTRDKPRK